MKTTLRANLIIDDKQEVTKLKMDEDGCVTSQETSMTTLKQLFDSGKFKAEFIPTYLQSHNDPTIIITEL